MDAFLRRFQHVISCVGDVHIAGDGYEPERYHAITMRPFQPGPGDRLQLQALESGRPDLLLDVIYGYRIVRFAHDRERASYWVTATRYRYQIYDLAGTELLLYHWHPDGLSSVTAPHLHAACAPRVSLPRPRATEPRQVDVGKVHLPTNHVVLEDVIELLIRDLGVEPRPGFRVPGDEHYWETVLRDNRAAQQDSA